MGDKAWKKWERDSAALFGGARFWANSGEKSDFIGHTMVGRGLTIRGQCKLVRTLSLESLTKLADESEVDVVCVKVRRGHGKKSPGLVVMTFAKFKEFYGEEKEATATTLC